MATLKDRLLGVLGGITTSAAATTAKRAYESGYNDSGEDEPTSGTTKIYGYRKLGGGQRDFTAVDYASALDVVWNVYQSNPIARRLLQIRRDYILGRGITPRAEDEDLQEIIDSFWSSNKLDRRSKEFTFQLFLFGVQCYPVFVRESDGRVKLGYIDPSEIEDVISDPENSMEMRAVVVQAQEMLGERPWLETQSKRVYRIIQQGADSSHAISVGEDGHLETEDRSQYMGKWLMASQAILEEWEVKMLKKFSLEEYSGSCFYEKVNAVSNQPRGYSDLLSLTDWLDQHDTTLFDVADREGTAGYFSWDVEMEGADKTEIDARVAEIVRRPPKKGSVNVHNEKEKWTFNYPDLKSAGSVEVSNALLNMILGGGGVPRHWYGSGDETNRATAQAQGGPTWRSLEHDQDLVQDLFIWMLEFVRDQAELAGGWSPGEVDMDTLDDAQPIDPYQIDVIMPEMVARDLAIATGALSAVMAAIMTMLDLKLITRVKATEVLAKVVAELGVEVDPVEELAAAELEQGAIELDGAGAKNYMLAGMLGDVGI